MARELVPATRSNYLRFKESLQRARQGHEMLERKRQILVVELMSNVEAAREAQADVREAMARAFAALRVAALEAGAERLSREGLAIRPAHSLRVRTHSVVGVEVPEIDFRRDEQPLPYALSAGASGADEVLRRFQQALEPIVRLAEVENAVMRLAREVHRTQRRVHALEKIALPRYEETLKHIAEGLQEREREDLVTMKKVKAMRQASRTGRPGPTTREGAR